MKRVILAMTMGWFFPAGLSGAETAQELKEFDSIKNLIKNDLLEEEVQKKKASIIEKKIEKKRLHLEKYNFPSQEDFWTFMSEYWLVKNAQKINWDFEKPDYGLAAAVKQILESVGHYEKKIKILLLKTPTIPHFALPSDNNEYIFLISQPFIRTLDLTKQEISLMILEDFFRSEMSYFKNFVTEKELEKWLGKNFYKDKPDPSLLQKVLANYDLLIYKKGFSFQQQYEITQKMGNILKADPKLGEAYNRLLQKIDTLVKTDSLYGGYNKIYPSPEFQLKWLKPSPHSL